MPSNVRKATGAPVASAASMSAAASKSARGGSAGRRKVQLAMKKVAVAMAKASVPVGANQNESRHPRKKEARKAGAKPPLLVVVRDSELARADPALAVAVSEALFWTAR